MKPRIAYCSLLMQAAVAATYPQFNHGASTTPSVETVFSLPSIPSWFENLAYRPSTNTIITTRLDVPQIWSIDPTTHEGTLLANITETSGLIGITQLISSPDTFIVASANFSTFVQPNSSVLWNLTFSEDGSASVTQAAAVPQMGLVNGLARWDDRTVLAADSTMGLIWKVDLDTGEATVALADPTMAPVESNGVNGVKVYRPRDSEETFVYYTSTDQGLLARVPVSSVTAEKLPADAPVEIIAGGLNPDDFALLDDGSVYLTTGANNTVVHVALDGGIETVAGSLGDLELASSTACQFGPEGQLYVTTAGGLEGAVNGTLLGPGNVVLVNLGAL
ncbi:uncharacterized protein J7T55_000498 [Diaporthe amygdali]|uniref:uncharacterized protein n=1 Tax=Phomopsis amygdali TaxID=1214568 RepID=UPI0022FEEDAB|nr:uncharacterized protein J7T55_000498 [Diaporthe amygdali]KAJ0104147.1 uncharacterized protein J7T55_000498 [Diaporthe amygdali]